MMKIRTDTLPDTTTLGHRRIFMIATGPVSESEKAIRHVVIFDNHPASLRLLLGSNLIRRRENQVVYAVLAIASVLAAGLGMFWLLF